MGRWVFEEKPAEFGVSRIHINGAHAVLPMSYSAFHAEAEARVECAAFADLGLLAPGRLS
jgi:hypothetical protein